MNRGDLRIVYMGTSRFAVESLRALVEGGYRIAGVVTPPDKPAGRHGNARQPCPVKQYAVSKGLPALQPERLKDAAFLSALRAWKADIQIVTAFRMLPEIVWNMPRLGTFNLHASLLPRYRGAAPINWAIINGETTTGVTTFFLTHEMDAGRIILQKELPIAETDDAGVVHDALMKMGAGLVLETVELIVSGKAVSVPQKQLCNEGAELPPAPKIFNETCRIDWHLPAGKVYDFIRGLSPCPAAWTELVLSGGGRHILKIYQSEKRFVSHSIAAGTLVSDTKNFLDIAVADGFVRLLSLQLAGKKRMNIADFLNGFKQTEGAFVV
ncbi:MAG: methionyl-tRNA formyltransferase [Bacteroidales bacterium]